MGFSEIGGHGLRAAHGSVWIAWILASAASGDTLPEPAPIFREATFEELAKVEVTVASDQLERPSDAPGSVTAYTAEDIEESGYLTLRELAEFTPGYSTRIGSDEKQNWSLETRGGTASLNEKHLVRIDGIPVNHARNGRALINDELPLFFADRVEFLRGPASSLYGIGAFNGVINIIPKTRKENGTFTETKFFLGSDFLRDSLDGAGNYNREGALVLDRRGLANIISKTDRREVQLSLGLYTKAPDLITYAQRGGPDQNQRKGIFGRLNEKLYAGAFGDVTLGLLYMEMEHGYGTSWAGKSQPPNFQRWTTAIPYVKHDVDFTDKIGLESYVKYNESRETGLQTNREGWWTGGDTTKTGIFDFNALAPNWEAFSKLRYDVTDKASLLAGLDYDVRWQDRPYTFISESNEPVAFSRDYDKKAYTYSAFVQARDELRVLKGLILTAGVRSDNGYLDGNTYYQLSPRLAAVQRITEGLNLKLMYGTALKAPGQDNLSQNKEKQFLFDLYNDTNTIHQVLKVGDLSAETIRTFESNLTFTAKRLYLSGTGFYNIIENQLQRGFFIRADSTQRRLIELSDYWLNAGSKQTAYGAELETRFLIAENLKAWMSGSYTRAMDENDVPVAAIPPLKIGLGLDYLFSMGLNVFVAMKWIPDFTSPTGSNSDATVHGLDVVDVNVTQKLSDHITAALSVANLLDEDFPESVSEAYPGRTVIASIGTHF
jgi:outer membrane receptor for ferrienterochelin and colicins